MHKIVKITANEDGDPVEIPKWHLAVIMGGGWVVFCTNEVFGEGEGSAKYKEKSVKRGGITCKDCLGYIKEIKSVKL
jgi:hypothetical protein